jgi:hypothetical protein
VAGGGAAAGGIGGIGGPADVVMPACEPVASRKKRTRRLARADAHNDDDADQGHDLKRVGHR